MNIDINELLANVKEELNTLKDQTIELSLYTEYDPCEYYSSKDSFILYEDVYSGYHILSLIKPIIRLLFDWDYKMSAKFDVVITKNSFDIVFHEPLISYKSTTKMFSLKE